MRPLLLLPVLLACGCSDVARTTTVVPPQRVDRDGTIRQAAYVLAPVYADDRLLVWLACQRAAIDYFGHVDHEDRDAGTLSVHDTNAWWGDSDIEVTLVPVEGGTRVDVVVTHPGGEIAQNREMSVLERYVPRVEREVITLRGLRELGQTPAIAGAGSTAASASATSLP